MITSAIIIVLLLALGLVSCREALLSGSWKGEGRRKWAFLFAGVLGGVYLSVGLVYASESLRWYGAPLPVFAMERMPGAEWGEFSNPFGLLVAGPNFVFWMGVVLAPISVPSWWRRTGRALWGRLLVVRWWKALVVIGSSSFLVVFGVAIYGAVVPRHVVIVRNATTDRMSTVGVRCGLTTHYVGAIPPGEERTFECEELAPGPYGISRDRQELGTCQHPDAQHGRQQVSISGSSGRVVSCDPP
jgi:hypothetical protein